MASDNAGERDDLKLRADTGADRQMNPQKGIFDQLAEYLIQRPTVGADTPAAGAAPLAPASAQEQLAEERPVAGHPGSRASEGAEMTAHNLVFVETAERLSVEKELFVREEVVLSKLIEEKVQEIEDSVRRTEVEVERLTPAEADRLAEGDVSAQPPAPVSEPLAATPQARAGAVAQPPIDMRPSSAPSTSPAPIDMRPPPIARTPPRPAATTSKAPPPAAQSASWWAWFALIVLAAVLIAFAAGQFLGSASG